ncbi:hypothetical protein ACVFI8_17550 [Agarivorans sp. MS3-6]|uniref:transporter substrate-binding domain-containing protein n=1 Tax=Agarivorans sp. TSD2052 TaxID=2937286 RepID=UPI00200D1C49|nr:transporter substrate-binding domain-containing protein [Agarivorans sp. TSD2052]UPW17348.1 transporter substrate-binding domain-containing protein [Agarivorans sp. TSD2052]
MSRYIYILLFCIILQPLSAMAVDIVRYNQAHSELDKRDAYPLQVVTAALEATRAEYGEYEIVFSPVLLRRKRALQELHEGKLINIYSAPSSQVWERSIEPIYFPILKGLLGYRRLLIHNENAHRFEQLDSLEQLKQLRAGLGLQWTTTKVLKKQDFTVVTSSSYEGLFGMLNHQRFDYFIRGINEIYYEYEERASIYPNMIIEQTKALHLPLPVFLFVSPSEPRLRQRIEKGLWQLHNNGEFTALFNRYHADNIRRSDLKNKTIFKIENDQLSAQPIYDNQQLWVDPLDY